MKRAQSSGAISSICTTRRMWSARTVDIPTAALLTSTSRRPKRAIVRATLSRQAAGSDTSMGSAIVRSAPSSSVQTKDALLGRVAKRHAHAGADEGAREGLADAAGGAGDERDAAVEVGCGHESYRSNGGESSSTTSTISRVRVTPVPQTRSNSAIWAANAAESRMFSASSTLGNS